MLTKDIIDDNEYSNIYNNRIKKGWKEKYGIPLFSLRPVVSSAICAVYVVLMYKDVHSLIVSGTDAINSLNISNANDVIKRAGFLEDCILNKLPICS